LVEDDPSLRQAVAAMLRRRSLEVLEADSCEGALALFSTRPDVVLTDLRLPDSDAVTMLPQLRSIDPSIAVYIMTGFATIDVAVRAVKLGAEDFFTKPVDPATLLNCVKTSITQRRLKESGKRWRPEEAPVSMRDVSTAPAVSETMQRLEAELERLRNSECTVLILGETGTGKSALARQIHELGARSRGPFVDVNCAGLSREPFESELFGHFDAANDGTLFLDEIGDIDLQVQPKILKALEERRALRTGAVRQRSADVRLIAATHHDLLAAVESKTFRADLFYRISTVTLTMPSLRERRADIPALVAQILQFERAPEVGLTEEAWQKITGYSWPGNIRELKNVLHRALMLRQDDTISANDVRFDGDVRPADPSSSQTLEQIEREHIVRTLDAENGRVKDAARRLGVPRSTLYQKMKHHGIPLAARTRGTTPPEPSES
jgi:DNA-binding NtrC family response regulator